MKAAKVVAAAWVAKTGIQFSLVDPGGAVEVADLAVHGLGGALDVAQVRECAHAARAALAVPVPVLATTLVVGGNAVVGRAAAAGRGRRAGAPEKKTVYL